MAAGPSPYQPAGGWAGTGQAGLKDEARYSRNRLA
jgi:hypothetical protein